MNQKSHSGESTSRGVPSLGVFTKTAGGGPHRRAGWWRSSRTAAVFLPVWLLTVAPLPWLVTPVQAAGIVVNTVNDADATDGVCSLREAISAANTNATYNECTGSGSFGDDTITFDSSSSGGTITLGSTLPAIVSGQGTLTIDGAGQSITISGNNSVRIFVVNSGATLTLNNLTVSNGFLFCSDEGCRVWGGAIHNSGTVNISNSTFSNDSISCLGEFCTALSGAIYNHYNSGTVNITNSTFSSNSANGGALEGSIPGDGEGGAIYNYGTANISNSTFSGNSASDIGGIFNTYNTVNIKNSIVANSTGGNCYKTPAATFNASGVNFDTDGTCPGFTQKTSAELNLGPLANNGGPTQTHALLAGSVAIDAVTDCTDLAGNSVTQDQRGVSRP